MLGAILGDIVGSRFEARGKSHKSKLFDLFTPDNHFTDDTVLTVAVADALLTGSNYADVFRDYFERYPYAGYGGQYKKWASDSSAEAYGSWGNGSAMRVSPVGWWAASLDDALTMAEKTAMPTHGHYEAVIGAQAVAGAIYLARSGAGKVDIKNFVEQISDYDLDRSCDDIRPGYHFDVTCKGTVPPAIIAFLEATGFEDAIRNAVSLGGDSDTLTCITGGIAEAYYGIPDGLRAQTLNQLDGPMRSVVAAFGSRYINGNGRT